MEYIQFLIAPQAIEAGEVAGYIIGGLFTLLIVGAIIAEIWPLLIFAGVIALISLTIANWQIALAILGALLLGWAIIALLQVATLQSSVDEDPIRLLRMERSRARSNDRRTRTQSTQPSSPQGERPRVTIDFRDLIRNIRLQGEEQNRPNGGGEEERP